MNPKYPIYIVSKSRAKKQLTSTQLSRLGVDHYVVIEQEQYDDYAANQAERSTLLVLDTRYQDEYDTCDALGSTKSKGPGPARNFAWEHSIEAGGAWHWVMDDNILGFYRMNRNAFFQVTDGTIFRAMEEFSNRYSNLAMAGPQYFMFAPRKAKMPPFVKNTRIYSCNLIRNDVEYRWRGRYNEDTDLSLRMLKDKWCTVQFNAFLQEKMTTQKAKGGNTEAFYAKEGTLPKSKMLVDLHPDVARLVHRFGRIHHHVKYRGFTHKLVRRKGLVIPEGINEFGMQKQFLVDEGWIDANSSPDEAKEEEGQEVRSG